MMFLKDIVIFFQVYAKPNKEEKKKKRKRSERSLQGLFFFCGANTYKPNAGRLFYVERLLQAICVLGATERADALRMSPLAA